MDEHLGLITSQGRVYGTDGRRELARKQPLHHRWIATASYTLSAEQAEAIYAPGNQVILDETNLWDLSVGCIDCEQPYPSVKDQKCRAPEYRG